VYNDNVLEISGVYDDNTGVHDYNRNTEVNEDNNAIGNTLKIVEH